MMIHIMKIRGTGKMADHLEIRDESFLLIAYFSVDHPEKALERCGLSEFRDKILHASASIPYGKIEGLRLD